MVPPETCVKWSQCGAFCLHWRDFELLVYPCLESLIQKSGNLVRNCWAFVCIRHVTCVNTNFHSYHSQTLAWFPFYSWVDWDWKGSGSLLSGPTVVWVVVDPWSSGVQYLFIVCLDNWQFIRRGKGNMRKERGRSYRLLQEGRKELKIKHCGKAHIHMYVLVSWDAHSIEI